MTRFIAISPIWRSASKPGKLPENRHLKAPADFSLFRATFAPGARLICMAGLWCRPCPPLRDAILLLGFTPAPEETRGRASFFQDAALRQATAKRCPSSVQSSAIWKPPDRASSSMPGISYLYEYSVWIRSPFSKAKERPATRTV